LLYILGWVFAVLLGSVWYSFASCQDDFTSCRTECWFAYANCVSNPGSTVTCRTTLASCNNTCTNNKKSCEECHGIKLNTNFPIIWNCIEINGAATNPTNAFPYMIWALTKIVMSLILVVCLIFVIWAGILRSADKPDQAKKMLKRVAITILLLWSSGVILKLVNPNFFY
jgi:hypothetical protein